MIYTQMTKKAMKLCFEAHKEQTDRSGLPYVFHPFHLAEQMPDEDSTVAALLHDVAEDTCYTLSDLKSLGFCDSVLDALALLTHDDSVPYLSYVWKLRGNRIARLVKQADLRHNSNLSRLDRVTEADTARLLKYKMAAAILDEHPREYDGTYRVRMPLDHDRLYFLTMFYRESGPDRYSLDAEYADDVHYVFSAKDSEGIKRLLPDAESLPEALSEFLRDHSEEGFADLLRKNSIPVQGFHF